MRRNLIAGLTVAALLALGAVSAAQPPAGERPEAAEQPAAPPGQEAPLEGEDIDEILEGEEAILAGEGYTYDPGGRRDPFKSLLEASERPDVRGPRPQGIPGLMIDEVTLTGIFITPQGPVAQVRTSDKEKSFLLREGDQLYDGDVVNITLEEVAFKQMVNDPTALKPFREVVKRLNP